MKILHVTKKYPGALGGDAVVVANLQAQQGKQGHDVSILTSNCKEIVATKRIKKFGLVHTPASLDRLSLLRLLSLAMLFVTSFISFRKLRPDVIHTHSIDMAFVVSWAARMYKIPLVHTFHILTFYDMEQAPWRRKIELWLVEKARLRVITAPNAHDVNQLRRAGFKQTVLLPNGVDLEFWQPDAQPATRRRELFTFISMGRLETQKGYEYVIQAAAQLRLTAVQPFRILIAGEGSQRKYLAKMAQELDVSDLVVFVGRKTPTEIRSMLSEADMAIFASQFETTPLTLLEAWAIGIPVISTRVGILRNIPLTTQRVFAVQPKDDYGLAAAMQVGMSSRAYRAKVGAQGHKQAAKYTWKSIAHTAEAMYGGML